MPRRGRHAGEKPGKEVQPDLRVWEHLCRSVIESCLRTVACRHLNRLAGWRNVEAFDADEVEPLVEALVYTVTAEQYACLWFEDEGGPIPGLSTTDLKIKFCAQTGVMPLSWLRHAAARVARMLILPGDEPYRIEFWVDRRVQQEWLRHPNGERPATVGSVIPDADIAYFKIHGVYPPHWRPEAQRKSEWGTAAARRSWKNRKNDPALLLELPTGLTAKEQVLYLRRHEVEVSMPTVNRWRKTLLASGVVIPGQEPWHTSTTTRKVLS